MLVNSGESRIEEHTVKVTTHQANPTRLAIQDHDKSQIPELDQDISKQNFAPKYSHNTRRQCTATSDKGSKSNGAYLRVSVVLVGVESCFLDQLVLNIEKLGTMLAA